MKLVSIKVHGYKRFAKSSSMNVDGKLVAVVGPNEAGKSSFLAALMHLNHDEPLVTSGGAQETSRNSSVPEGQDVIEARYLLEDADREALRDVHGGTATRWFTVSKQPDEAGSRYYGVEPTPQRSLQPRRKVVQVLNHVVSRQGFLKVAEREESFLEDRVEDLASTLTTEEHTLSDSKREKIQSLAEELKNLLSDDDPKYLHNLQQQLESLAGHEAGNPFRQAMSVLISRLPRFLLFTDQERTLLPEYGLDGVYNEPPPALRNLARVAQLDLPALFAAVDTGDHALAQTLLAQANATLGAVFAEAWSQSDVAVGFSIDGYQLRVFVTESKIQHTNIAERSDGLRQFVALLAFTTVKRSDRTAVLLIDEADTHLHYDAQADLVQMLTKQEIVPKVIYTTHSIGCLPEDLGTGVRIVEPDSTNERTSRIRNWFWVSAKPGFSPLLFGMGASTLAFIPIRHAVVTEGISDIILWPSLLREAMDSSYLDFQVVPGISETSVPEITQLDREAPRTAYLLDADEGGKKLLKQLKKADIAENRIFSIPDEQGLGLVVEDLLDPAIYLEAVNEELGRSHGLGIALPKTNLPAANRPKAIADWCKREKIDPPSKRAVAYHVIEKTAEHSILPKRYYSPLQRLHADISAVFDNSTA